MRFAITGLMVATILTGAAPQPAPPAPRAWVTIKGQVVLPAATPIPARQALPANAAACPKGPILDETWVVNPKTRGIRNVVVWLRPDDKNPKAAFTPAEIHPADAARKPRDVVIDQPCCAFEPHVTAARAGDTLVVKNAAAIAHNFMWDSVKNGGVNVVVQPGGQFRFDRPLAAESVSLMFKCTIHPWMTGYVRVFDHPHYAVTDDAGAFEIKNAPAGKYRLVYWHETGFKGKAAGRFGDPITTRAGGDGVMTLKSTVLE